MEIPVERIAARSEKIARIRTTYDSYFRNPILEGKEVNARLTAMGRKVLSSNIPRAQQLKLHELEHKEDRKYVERALKLIHRNAVKFAQMPRVKVGNYLATGRMIRVKSCDADGIANIRQRTITIVHNKVHRLDHENDHLYFYTLKPVNTRVDAVTSEIAGLLHDFQKKGRIFTRFPHARLQEMSVSSQADIYARQYSAYYYDEGVTGEQQKLISNLFVKASLLAVRMTPENTVKLATMLSDRAVKNYDDVDLVLEHAKKTLV